MTKHEYSTAIRVRLERIGAIYARYPDGTWKAGMSHADREAINRLDAELQALFIEKAGAA